MCGLVVRINKFFHKKVNSACFRFHSSHYVIRTSDVSRSRAPELVTSACEQKPKIPLRVSLLPNSTPERQHDTVKFLPLSRFLTLSAPTWNFVCFILLPSNNLNVCTQASRHVNKYVNLSPRECSDTAVFHFLCNFFHMGFGIAFVHYYLEFSFSFILPPYWENFR